MKPMILRHHAFLAGVPHALLFDAGRTTAPRGVFGKGVCTYSLLCHSLFRISQAVPRIASASMVPFSQSHGLAEPRDEDSSDIAEQDDMDIHDSFLREMPQQKNQKSAQYLPSQESINQVLEELEAELDLGGVRTAAYTAHYKHGRTARNLYGALKQSHYKLALLTSPDATPPSDVERVRAEVAKREATRTSIKRNSGFYSRDGWANSLYRDIKICSTMLSSHRALKDRREEKAYLLRTMEVVNDLKSQRFVMAAKELAMNFQFLLLSVHPLAWQEYSLLYLRLSVGIAQHAKFGVAISKQLERQKYDKATEMYVSRYDSMFRPLPPPETAPPPQVQDRPTQVLDRTVSSTVLIFDEQQIGQKRLRFNLTRPSQKTSVGKSLKLLGFGHPPAGEEDAEDSIMSQQSRLSIAFPPLRYMKSLPPAGEEDAEDSIMSQQSQLSTKSDSPGPHIKRFVTHYSKPFFNLTPRRKIHQSMFSFTENTMTGQYPDMSSSDVNLHSYIQYTASAGGDDHDQTTKSNSLNEEAPPTENTTPIEDITLNEQAPPPPNSDNDEESDNSSDNESEQSETEMQRKPKKPIPLSYQMSPEALQTALAAPPNTKASYWSQHLYRGPNQEGIATHYCVNMEVAETVARHFINEKVLGFDIEWKPMANPYDPKLNASLIQLASENRIALFHVALFKGKMIEQLVPPMLKRILESPDILKVGVAIKADFTRLKKHLGINAQGVMELSRTHNLIQGSDSDTPNHKLVKLATQVEQHLLLPLYKGEPLADDPEPEDEMEKEQWQTRQGVRESDWSKKLNTVQIHYAAADAYAGFRLYDILEAKRKQLKPVPPLPRLCDDDPETKPRAPAPKKKKTKTVKLSKEEAAKLIAESSAELPVEGLEMDESEEDATLEYQTAAEELESEEEDEVSSSEASSEDSEQYNEDSDDDYIPRSRARAGAALDADVVQEAQTARKRRIGRLDFSRLKGEDPGYPVLPTVSSDEASASESDAFEPVPAPRPRRRAARKVATQVPEPTDSGDMKELSLDPSNDEEFNNLSDSGQALMRAFLEVRRGEDQNGLQDKNGLQKSVNDIDSMVDPPAIPGQPKASSLAPAVPSTSSHSPQYTLATTWAQGYLESNIPSSLDLTLDTSRIRATVPHLRAYYLWYFEILPLDAIGACVRDPPLTQATVASYILQAIQLEKMVYREEALREMLMAMPVGLRLGRWKGVAEKVGIKE